MVKYTYPIVIFGTDFSSYVNQILHYSITTSFSSNMQGSHLVVRKNCNSKPENDWLPGGHRRTTFINFTQISDGQYKALFSRLIYKFQLLFFGDDCAHTNSEYRAPFQVPSNEANQTQISSTIRHDIKAQELQARVLWNQAACLRILLCSPGLNAWYKERNSNTKPESGLNSARIQFQINLTNYQRWP